MQIAGIDIGGTGVKIGVYDEHLTLLHTRSKPSPFGDPGAMVELIADMLTEFSIDVAGVGTAGSIDSRTREICTSNLGWRHVRLYDLLYKRLSIPLLVDNDAQAAMMAEWYDGACQGLSCAAYLTLGTGIGGGLLIDGKPWRGLTHKAVEFGHMITHADGLPCRCTKNGCFEMYASASALSRMAGGINAQEVIEKARQGDAQMLDVFDEYVHELCIGLTNIIMIFTPQAIVLGGGISYAGAFLTERCQAELKRLFSRRRDELTCEIAVAKHRNEAGILGAAVMARENLIR